MSAGSPRPRIRFSARTSTRSPVASVTVMPPTMFLIVSDPPSPRRADQTNTLSPRPRAFCAVTVVARPRPKIATRAASLAYFIECLETEGWCAESDTGLSRLVWTDVTPVPLSLSRALSREQTFLPLHAPSVAAEGAVRSHDAMTRNHDRDPIAGTGTGHRTRCVWI